jgi:hypothetical protein
MCMIRQCLITCNQLIQIRTDKLLHKTYLYTGVAGNLFRPARWAGRNT